MNEGALSSLTIFRMSAGVEVCKYGSHSEQFFRLSTPADRQHVGKIPIVVIFHGGFWKQKYNLDNAAIETLCPYFLAKGMIFSRTRKVLMIDLFFTRTRSLTGYAVCEVEYRRREHEGGGFPGTNMDCVAALRLLHEKSMESSSVLDIHKTILLGHSAGGYLVLWLCCSKAEYFPKLPFSPILCVAVSPVTILKVRNAFHTENPSH